MKKVLYLSNYSKARTGFGRHAKSVLSELWKSGYEVVEISCGKKYSDPELKSLPWKAYGTIPDNDQEIAPIQNNPQQIEAMFFGNWTIDRIIKNEKPDAIILVEDIWKIQWAFYKPWFNRIPTLIHTPVDSSPVLPLIKDNKAILKNLWVKADFAVNDLEGVGIRSKSVPLLTDQSFFKPLSEAERNNLRKTFGLEDSFVIGFVFRNQLRKLVISLMRDFKKFKNYFPDSKAKLLLHTNFDEGGMGWNIPVAAENLGIDKNDLLCTYICHSCKAVQILPFMGNSGIGCGRCGAKDSLKNPTIDVGVTDEELNAIYNMMDFYCHPATSGGFEGPMSESALAGIPSATCDYAFGETFVRQGYSIPIKYTIVDELNSGFMKSQPIEGSICDAMEEVYLHQDEYKEIGLKAREWALEKFDLQKGIQEYKDWIDDPNNENPNTFDYDTDFYDLKNVDFPPNYSIESNTEFVIDTYSGIFGIRLAENSEDIKKYCRELSYKSREQVVGEMKAVAEGINQQQKPVTIKDFLINKSGEVLNDNSTKSDNLDSEKILISENVDVTEKGVSSKKESKKIALICRGSVVECFNLLAVIPGVKKRYPEYDLYICAHPEHSVIFDHLEGENSIANFVPYHPQMEDICSLEGRKGWEGMFDLAFAMPEHQHHNGII